ncbi:uncharacterized protein LOC111692289 [Anoplophora glabripennis]|uniref:uncharacterized protein LOC111691913 n=1 Tax=Anoplophora glabripennis TaxID=217634 RepID=UPI000C76BE5D|nr:uncharacterized protein LOC111691913 [Anoplophora glabripennis]XP_023311972.1 uncharacterized protein LOC111692289 [Anoplophora glabripennis]
MEQYTIEQRAQIVELYFSNQRSIVLTQRAYRRYFNVRVGPSESTINRLVANFRQQGAVRNLPGAGRRRTVHTDDNIERVQESIREDGETSTRRRSTQLGLSRGSLQRILHTIRMFPYKIQLVQELKPTDYQQRLDYAIYFRQKAEENHDFIHNLIMSDEAHFQLNGFVNRQNCRIWATENPRVVQQRQLHPLKCTVWCGISSERIIGPYFFENEHGVAVSITGVRYRTMLENFLRPAVENHPQVWFQQDGATAHTARDTMALLRDTFGERIISRTSDFNWPPRSPDLTAPDFFLWGYLKGKVYINKPRTIQQLKNNIRDEINNITPEVLRKVMENVLERARICEAENGHHLRDIIFHN